MLETYFFGTTNVFTGNISSFVGSLQVLSYPHVEPLFHCCTAGSRKHTAVCGGFNPARQYTIIKICNNGFFSWETPMSIRLLIADDHMVIRTGLASLMTGTEIETVAEAATGKECIKQAEKVKPDVILLDVRMPGGDGLSTLGKLRAKIPNVVVVMMSAHDNPTYIARAVALGASDYILKGSSRDDIIATITAAGRGESPSRFGELSRVAGVMKINQSIDDEDIPLTQRETQVLRHVAFGLCNKEIGLSLGISVETVKEHVQNILRKLTVNDRTQAAVWALRKGLV